MFILKEFTLNLIDLNLKDVDVVVNFYAHTIGSHTTTLNLSLVIISNPSVTATHHLFLPNVNKDAVNVF